METIITLQPNELNQQVLEMLKNLISSKGFNNITISLTKKKKSGILRKESPKQTITRINKAIEEIENGSSNLISFTMDEFESFSRAMSKK